MSSSRGSFFPRRSSASPITVHPRDPAASMALIFDAMRHPLDPSYEEAARGRAARGEPSQFSRRATTWVVAAATVVVGILIGCAASALRAPKQVATDARSQIIGQVESRQSANESAASEVKSLRAELSRQQSSALSRAAQGDLEADLKKAQAVAGLTVSTGAGVTLTLDNPARGADADSADSNPRTATQAAQLTSSDLQRVVNGLWQAGATAVSVNDQRLTSLSAIRFAGAAVLVNYRPLTTPYVVRAIGPSSLGGAFDADTGGQYLGTLRRSGFRADQSTSSSVTVPAAAAAPISHAVSDR